MTPDCSRLEPPATLAKADGQLIHCQPNSRNRTPLPQRATTPPERNQVSHSGISPYKALTKTIARPEAAPDQPPRHDRACPDIFGEHIWDSQEYDTADQNHFIDGVL